MQLLQTIIRVSCTQPGGQQSILKSESQVLQTKARNFEAPWNQNEGGAAFLRVWVKNLFTLKSRSGTIFFSPHFRQYMPFNFAPQLAQVSGMN